MDLLAEENERDGSLAYGSSKTLDYYENYDREEDYSELVEDAEVDTSPVDITEATLKQIERELCLIRLSWPDVVLGDSRAHLPESYRTVSDKEKVLLWHAENFRKQYHTIYKDRKPLLMACDNECGVQKFVSTSIRPSTLPYPELYTWQGCAKFVCDHLEYEPPKTPRRMNGKNFHALEKSLGTHEKHERGISFVGFVE